MTTNATNKKYLFNSYFKSCITALILGIVSLSAFATDSGRSKALNNLDQHQFIKSTQQMLVGAIVQRDDGLVEIAFMQSSDGPVSLNVYSTDGKLAYSHIFSQKRSGMVVSHVIDGLDSGVYFSHVKTLGSKTNKRAVFSVQ